MNGFIFILIFFSSSAKAWDIDTRSDIQGNGFARSLNQTGFSSRAGDANLQVLGGLQFRATDSGFQFDARPEFRAILGPAASAPTTDPEYLTVRSPDRFVNMRVIDQKDSNGQVALDFEKLMLSYSTDKMEIHAGRSPVSLGVLKVFPVWNKFTRPLPGISGPAIIYGQDNAGFRYQDGNFLFRAFTIQGPAAQGALDSVYLGELTWYGSFAELHGLVSQWWNEIVGGLAFAKDIGGMTVRGEGLWIGFREADEDRQFQGGLGLEYAFNDKWSVLGESLYQSEAATNVLTYPVTSPSRYTSLRAAGYSFLQVNYQATPFWLVGLGALTNLVDYGSVLVLRANRSLGDNTDFFLEGDLPVGREGAEFSSRSLIFSDGSSIGVASQFSIGIKTTF